ncbi:hypothetical protein CN988_16505 [Bacillus thuringiensis]|uniref:Uncharacterized protein n=1 Tax=Bacillus thuringiensis TaxID=1428 RepID=A0ABD6R4V2_BACTU|nr:hypothetical protein [Bacillus thuringiensis]OTY05572.1 hypothetical protein BK734_22160 [Bacillus thuringiensis serovar kim]PFU83520.1 hypothetical protein COK91_07330 [Bacillus cereus]OPD49231.1 hypothetical protein BVF97_19530 [Bacillus thuringiensis]PER49762.1 hypothetical protein CN486_29125 [Bacillus thuringiensis]
MRNKRIGNIQFLEEMKLRSEHTYNFIFLFLTRFLQLKYEKGSCTKGTYSYLFKKISYTRTTLA